MNEVVETTKDKMLTLYEQLDQRTEQFQKALPAHMPVERFKRVILTAVQNVPALAFADRRTFFNASMKCAQDGLLPDGREAALVIYKTKIKDGSREYWTDAVQYIPMIGGLRKKVRNSGEIATWDVKAVYEKDEFIYEEGLDVILKHKPYMDGPAGKLRAVYSVCRLKSGEVSVDVMPVWQVERIRLLSKSGERGPWKDHYDEMAKKTVARRHSKVLPMSTDLDDLIRRDDDLYDLKGASDAQQLPAASRPKLSDFSEMPTNGLTEINPKTGEIIEEAHSEAAEAAGGDQPSGAPEVPAEPEKPASDREAEIVAAEQRGAEARRKGVAYRAVPPEFREDGNADLGRAWQRGWQTADKAIHAGETQAG